MNERPKFPVIGSGEHATVDLSLEQRYTILHNIFKHQFFSVHRRIAERFGWEAANEIAGEVAAESTATLAEAYRRKFALPGSGAALASQVLQIEFLAEGSDAAAIEETADSAELEIHCSFGAALQRRYRTLMPLTDGLCERGCRLWAKSIAASISDDLDVERVSWMPDGAARCRYRIRRGHISSQTAD